MDNKEKNINYFAVVIGDWHFNTLGMVRSLGERGIPVVYINMSDFGYAESSKYTKKTYHAKTEKEVIDAIIQSAEEFNGCPVLFPGSDSAAMFIDNSYDLLKDKCICPGLKGNMSYYMNKYNMCELAKQSGFCVPRSTLIDIETCLDDLCKEELPIIIKPVASVEGRKCDIKICLNDEDLSDAIEFFKDPDNNYQKVLVQQFLDGQDNLMVEYCGCKSAGKKVKVLGQIEKIREYPVDRGSTTYAVIKEEITYIDINCLDEFLETVGYEGLFDLEIKVVDGKPYFIEINFRNGAPSYGFTAAGFNVPFAWFADNAGISYMPSIKQVYLMSERDDLNNLKDKNVSLFKWISDVKNTNAFMVYNPKDTAPFEGAYGKSVTKVLGFLASKSK